MRKSKDRMSEYEMSSEQDTIIAIMNSQLLALGLHENRPINNHGCMVIDSVTLS